MKIFIYFHEWTGGINRASYTKFDEVELARDSKALALNYADPGTMTRKDDAFIP
jgi:hypothetical protein